MTTSAYDNLPDLTTTEKLVLAEQLWADLAANADELTPPKWHQDVLRAREDEWENRDPQAEDWNIARASLLNELK